MANRQCGRLHGGCLERGCPLHGICPNETVATLSDYESGLAKAVETAKEAVDGR